MPRCCRSTRVSLRTPPVRGSRRTQIQALDRTQPGLPLKKGRGATDVMGGQIVDATIVDARRPRLTEAEKAVVKGGGTPEDWKPSRTRQIDRDGRWTLKRGRKRPTPPEGAKRIATGEILVPAFGYKNHLSMDRPARV